ncbi:hypothetical protein L3Y34_005511 [Caenorhabditis briggsae]|uniref:Uncharacterized protein n=1 Tax=Caenorhabditis briggsae TaxID=6238 RepID=A0AAE9AHV1_CAEBR|nr:hypothetical protein L3Y34_005511 [Caenorhabditis briggsae]
MKFLLISFFCIALLINSINPQNAPPNHQDVDHIEDIEVDETQIIITTTKHGPVEHLKIHIELVDIEANKKVNPVDLSGLWLTITRGRYTIPFLRPDTWYGVRFRSENLINGHTVIHEDERLIKTHPRGAEPNLGVALMGIPPSLGVQNAPYPTSPVWTTFSPNFGQIAPNSGVSGLNQPSETHFLGPEHPKMPGNRGNVPKTPLETHNTHKGSEHNAIDVKMHRSLDGVENFESLYVTVAWKEAEQEKRTNLTTGVVKLRVICDNSETKEEIKLKGDEDSVTLEITMDQKYDIEEMDTAKHQIKAHITPLKCHKICWTTDLVLSSGFGDFTKHLGSECKEISGTTSTTFLRNVKKVSVIENNLSENELVVETEVQESEYGIVTLILQKLGGNETEEPIKKTFDTASSNGRFVVPVEDDAIYAVIYNYVKTKPFHYTSKAHFLVESPAVNSTKPSHPLVDVSVIPTSFDYKHDKPDTVLKPEPPFLLISRSKNYPQSDLLVKIEPFCNETEQKFRLEDRYPQHQIDAVPFLCGLNPKMYFCNKNVTTWQKCDSTLCFSTSVLIGFDSFEADSRCLNVTQHFPPLVSYSSTTRFLSYFLCVSLFSILSPSHFLT